MLMSSFSVATTGRCSLVVKVSHSGPACHGLQPITDEDRRVGERCALNLSRAQMSSPWCGVVVHRGSCQLRFRPRHLTIVQNYEITKAEFTPKLSASSVERLLNQRPCPAQDEGGSGRLLHVLPLTPTHRSLRLERCHARGNWTAAEWKQVKFSDESRFNLSSDDNRVRVWRPRGERVNPAYALQ
ncbi:transposable element Tcb1 transposase [Trichonephila clavipes]|nr:transposable element Tcb1 transposase [Trichonephila clavipes]